MKKWLLIFFITITPTIFCKQTFFEKSIETIKTFFKILINPTHPCAVTIESKIYKDTGQDIRYTIIKTFLEHYTRPFTIIDLDPLGKNNGYTLFNISEQCECVYVISTKKEQSLILADFCKQHNLNNIIILQENVYEKRLQRMSECEDFDVMLLLNASNQITVEKLNILQKLGQNLILEIKKQDLHDDLKTYLQKNNAQMIATLINENQLSHIYLIQSYNNTLERTAWARADIINATYVITNTFEKKELIKTRNRKKTTTSWIPGINLLTFKICYGIYPEKYDIKEGIKATIELKHPDWLPTNMIIQGKPIKLIDFDIKENKLIYSKKLLDLMFTFIDFEETAIDYSESYNQLTNYQKRYYIILDIFRNMLILKEKPVELIHYKEPDGKNYIQKLPDLLGQWVIISKR